MTIMLKVDDLSVHYGVIQAVKNVSFEVHEGEVVSLIGANGAGKTSILRTISGLVRPSAGKIEFLGQEIQKALAKTNYRLKVASSLLAKDEQLYQEVLGYYYENYWKPLKMDFIDNTHTAKEIMVFIINVGLGRKRKMFKAIQKMLNKHNNCNLVVDGIIGKKTIDCLNKFDETTFSKLFDEFEIDFYDKLVKHYARLTWALKGWHKRARYV